MDFQVANFLGFIPLRIGVLLMGYTHMIVGLIGMCSVIDALREEAVEEEKIDALLTEITNRQDHPSVDKQFNDLRKHLVLWLIMFMSMVCTSMFAVVGGHMKKPKYVFVYFLSYIVLVGFALIGLIMSFFDGKFARIMLYIIAFVFQVYFLIVIRSAYIKMEYKNENNTVTYKAPPYIDETYGEVQAAAPVIL